MAVRPPRQAVAAVVTSVSAIRPNALTAVSKGTLEGLRTKATLSGVSSPVSIQRHPNKSTFVEDSTLPALSGAENVLQATPFRLTTLNQTRLTPSQFIDLSGKGPQGLATSLHSKRSGSGSAARLSRFKLIPSGMPHLRFPEHARGFLYYHLAPNSPPLFGQVRLRITDTNDPALFPGGPDLLRTSDGLPWGKNLISIAQNSTLEGMRHRLLEDGLVSQKLLQTVSDLPAATIKFGASSPRLVHAFGQPFVFGFGMTSQLLFFIGLDTVMPVRTGCRIFHCATGGIPSWPPVLTGTALCCFEKSTLPEHTGRRVVVCRVLRILKPVESTGISPIPDAFIPREGELVRTWPIRRAGPPEKTFDVDRGLAKSASGTQIARGLALLYDNEQRAGGPVGW